MLFGVLGTFLLYFILSSLIYAANTLSSLFITQILSEMPETSQISELFPFGKFYYYLPACVALTQEHLRRQLTRLSIQSSMQS